MKKKEINVDRTKISSFGKCWHLSIWLCERLVKERKWAGRGPLEWTIIVQQPIRQFRSTTLLGRDNQCFYALTTEIRRGQSQLWSHLRVTAMHLFKKKATWTYSKVLVTVLSFTSADHRSHHIHHSGIDKFRVVITQTPIAEFCHHPRISHRFGAFSSIAEPEGASGFWCGHQISWKYSIIPPTDKIQVFTSMQQIYEKFSEFSGSDKIRVLTSMHQIYDKFSKFSPTDKIRVFTSMHQIYDKFSKFSPTNKIRVLTSMQQIYDKFSKFSPTDKIRVFTSMHQIYDKFSKFSPTDKIRVFTSMHQIYDKFSKFSPTNKIRVFTSLHQIYSKFPKFSGTEKLRVLTSMHEMYSKFSKFSPTDKICVFTSMQQIYEKFSRTDKIRVLTSIHQIYEKFSTLSGADEIRVLTSMHQIYEKFSKFGYSRQCTKCIQNSGIDVNARNRLKILAYWQNSGYAGNVWKILWIVAYPNVNSRSSVILTPLIFS